MENTARERSNTTKLNYFNPGVLSGLRLIQISIITSFLSTGCLQIPSTTVQLGGVAFLLISVGGYVYGQVRCCQSEIGPHRRTIVFSTACTAAAFSLGFLSALTISILSIAANIASFLSFVSLFVYAAQVSRDAGQDDISRHLYRLAAALVTAPMGAFLALSSGTNPVTILVLISAIVALFYLPLSFSRAVSTLGRRAVPMAI